MHLQEVFNAIYANHPYEYLVINRQLKVIEYSDKVFHFCIQSSQKCDNINLMEAVPELFGLENEIDKIFKGDSTVFTLPYIAKAPDRYIHIHIHPGRIKVEHPSEDSVYETLIILFEDITDMANTQQNLVQERNEKSLLLEELSEKNAKLKIFNEQMQQLVEEESKKNLEKQKMVELQSRHSQMGEVIGMITHQWKQPLSVISLIVTILKTKNNLTHEKAEKKLDDILSQVNYMTQTVNDFQNFFNPSKEKVIFNIYENLHTILELVKYEYDYKAIDLELKGDLELLAYGYPNEFNQVVLSLLKNAKDAFMENPHESMKIEIIIDQKKGNPQILVRDNAGGIPEEMIDKIFDLYMTTKKNGSGLGLNIAKSMIEHNMNGQLSVSNIENGAEFSIMVPANERHGI
jgi:signal transduction histidine kinase